MSGEIPTSRLQRLADQARRLGLPAEAEQIESGVYWHRRARWGDIADQLLEGLHRSTSDTSAAEPDLSLNRIRAHQPTAEEVEAISGLSGYPHSRGDKKGDWRKSYDLKG